MDTVGVQDQTGGAGLMHVPTPSSQSIRQGGRV